MAAEKAALWKQAEALFSESPVHVIAVAKVQKSSSGVAQITKQKRLPKSTGKTRLVILTGHWDESAARVQLDVHSCKPHGNAYKINKSCSVSALLRLDVYQGEPGVLNSYHALEMTFFSGGGESKLTFQTQDEDVLLQILAPLWHMVVKFPNAEQKRPTLTTYPSNNVSMVVQMEAWNANHLDPEIERALASCQSGDADASGTEDGEGEAEDAERGGLSLVSAREERDLQALLDRCTLEVGDLEDFQQRLQAELAAIENANVHMILGSGISTERVRASLSDALGLLEDVNENLATFDTKLLVMREDIAAIEARNNRLELQTRNNGKLLSALESLIERLQLPPGVERALKGMHFSEGNLKDMVAAGVTLHEHAEALAEPGEGEGPVGISPALSRMYAVADQRTKFVALASAFAEQAAGFAAAELAAAADDALAAAGRGGALPDHSELRARTASLRPLLRVVRSLRPDVLDALGGRYTATVNTLLRKEVRLYTAELRRLVALGISAGASEPQPLRTARKDDARAVQPAGASHASLTQRLHLSERPAVGNATPPAGPVGRARAPGGGLQPHDAFSQLLRHWVPLLFEELDGCADFLMLKEDAAPSSASTESHGSKSPVKHSSPRGPESIASSSAKSRTAQIAAGGFAALEALLADLSVDFLNVADLVSRQQQIQAVPMLATAVAWQAKLADIPIAAPLRTLLGQCSARLLSNFGRFVNETAAAVQRFDSKGAASHADGAKCAHVLPVVPNFARMVGRLEELQGAVESPAVDFVAAPAGVAQVEAESDDDEEDDDASGGSGRRSDSGSEPDITREESLQIGSLGPGGQRRGSEAPGFDSDMLRKQLKGSLSQPLQRALGMGMRRTNQVLDTVDSLSEEGSPRAENRAVTEVEIPTQLPNLRLVHCARDVMDPAYAVLSKAIFGAIERVASADAKHGERMRLENYRLYEAAVGAHASKNAVLGFFVAAARSSKENAIQAYVQHQLEYAKLWRVVEFSQGVERLAAEIGAGEVPFQPGYQAHDLRALLAAATHHAEKRLSELRARVSRHLHGDAGLVETVWSELRARLEASYRNLGAQAAGLYPSVQLPLSPDALHKILSSLG